MRKAHSREGRQSVSDVDLDIDRVCIDAEHGGGSNAGKHLATGSWSGFGNIARPNTAPCTLASRKWTETCSGFRPAARTQVPVAAGNTPNQPPRESQIR